MTRLLFFAPLKAPDHPTPSGDRTVARLIARALKRDVLALWLAARDPRVPWYAKAVAGVVAAYALSPVDLIPDFVPVLGYVDVDIESAQTPVYFFSTLS